MMFIFTVWDVAVAISLVLFAVSLLIVWLLRSVKQGRCTHDHYFETGACDAVCRDCGKNLGFIGSVRRERDCAEKGAE